MKLDKKATEYRYGNGRFDLMTDEDVRTIDSDDLEMVLVRLADACRAGESTSMEEIYHRLYELSVRYPDNRFRLEAVPKEEE